MVLCDEMSPFVCAGIYFRRRATADEIAKKFYVWRELIHPRCKLTWKLITTLRGNKPCLQIDVEAKLLIVKT